jgi:hypothetical protein
MLTVKFMIIDVIARVGAFLCLKAIKLSGNGYINFEIGTNQDQISFMYQNQPTYPISSIFDFMRMIIKVSILCIVIGTITWTSLEIIY